MNTPKSNIVATAKLEILTVVADTDGKNTWFQWKGFDEEAMVFADGREFGKEVSFKEGDKVRAFLVHDEKSGYDNWKIA